jgi:4-hydroxy-tetrahydrodipicolinate synthase
MMAGASGFGGVIPAVATAFTARDEVDADGIARLVEHVIGGGVHAVMVTGGTGEFPHLLREEKRDVIAAAARAARGRVPVIAGTAACGTREAIALAEDAREAGADAVIVTPPYYFRLPEESLYDHFATLAAASPLPVVVYNNPLYTGNPLSPQLIARLAELPNIVGLKQSEDDLGQLVEVLRLAPARCVISTGIDSQFYPALCAGAAGIYSTAACIAPREVVAVYDAFQAGDHAQALECHRRLQPLNHFLEYDPGYVTPCKVALEMLGLPAGPARKPSPALSEEDRRGLREALKGLGLV